MPQNTYPAVMTAAGGPLSFDELATRMPLDETTGQTGAWVLPNRMFQPSTLLLTASTYFLARFVPRRTMRAIKISYVVTTFSATNDNVDVGIYDGLGNRLSSSGATAGQLNTSNGQKTVALPTPVVLVPNTIYYVGLACGASAAPATVLSITNTNLAAAGMFGVTAGTIETLSSAGATLPATGTFAATAFNVPALAVLEV